MTDANPDDKVEFSGNEVIHREPVEGWVGGFAESNPDFAYPKCDVSSLPILGNLDNIDKLERQMKVLWPEFSWQTVQGEEGSRCFQRFAPDISRLGYTNEGRVYSIICPQQGAYTDLFGAMNVEVTVTGQRGWANESAPKEEMMAADMGVVGSIWFSKSAHELPMLKRLVRYAEKKFKGKGYNFPIAKEFAIIVETHKVGEPDTPNFALRGGLTPRFDAPDFSRHDDEAFTVSYLDVQIGEIRKTGDREIDDFNQTILNVFNAAVGQMLQKGNILTWNVWFEAPTLVDTLEWRAHAEKWRRSIDADHGSPGGSSSPKRYADGKEFNAVDYAKDELEHAIGELKRFADHEFKSCCALS